VGKRTAMSSMQTKLAAGKCGGGPDRLGLMCKERKGKALPYERTQIRYRVSNLATESFCGKERGM